MAVRRLADPGWRETGLALMASTLRGLLDGAQAGSDVQLAYVRAFAGVATSADDLALLAGLLDGSAALDGLAVDTDLRWGLLSRLVSRGADGFGAERIEAELDRDATDAGQRNAEACRAAIPTAEAKRRPGTRWSRASRRWPRSAPLVRVRRPGPGGADRAVPGAVLRRGRGRVAGLVLGDGTGLRGRDLRRGRDLGRDGTGHGRLHRRREPAGRAAPGAHRGPRRRAAGAALPGEGRAGRDG